MTYSEMITGSLIELKAKVEDLQVIRNRIVDLTAKPTGNFRQIDTYFRTQKGRLKIRETERSDKVAIIYYEREDIIGPKKSEVTIVKIQKSLAFSIQKILDKALGVKAVVDKMREVYDYQGIQIHLDTVTELGSFIEFEKKVLHGDLDKERAVLRELMKQVGVTERNLEKGSYSDLLSLKGFESKSK